MICNNNYYHNVFNTYALNKTRNVLVLKNNPVNHSERFTQVAAVGRVKSYSRLEKIHSIFRGY